jgi:spermidine synthase
MTIFHEDARVFLRNNTKKYDAILGDAFGSYFSIPYQLTTLETAKEKYNTLYDNGVVILNIIGSMT